MTDDIKAAHDALMQSLAKVYTEAKRLGLLRTTSALNDALRLGHWESAQYFDLGYIPRRRSDMANRDHVTVLTVDDEVTTI